MIKRRKEELKKINFVVIYSDSEPAREGDGSTSGVCCRLFCASRNGYQLVGFKETIGGSRRVFVLAVVNTRFCKFPSTTLYANMHTCRPPNHWWYGLT